MSTYTVKSGDTISKIALNVLGNMNLWPKLAALNGIASPYLIYPGQVLQLPALTPAGVTASMPVPASASMQAVIPSTGSAGAKIMLWIQSNKTVIGGSLALLAVVALVIGSQKKAKRTGKKRHGIRTR